MKKILSSAAVLAMVATPALAQPAQVGSGQIRGLVQPVCGIDDLFGSLNFPTMTTGALVTDDFDLKCNDADGATLKVTSVENGLESDDNEDQVVQFELEITGTGVSAFDGIGFTTNGPGNNDISDSGTATSAADVAALMSGVTGNVRIELLGNGTWAGGYSDTIQLEVTAN